MNVSGLTDVGLVRTHNEDAYFAAALTRWGMNEVPEGIGYYLAIVADGMGGAAAGELASSLAVQHIIRVLTGDLLGFREGAPSIPTNIPGRLTDAVQEANDVIFTRALEEPSFAGMGTTVVVLLTFNGSAFWASVGDSRLYLFRQGEFRQVTEDHSYVNELVRQGNITSEQARRHPKRNLITRSVGSEDVLKVDTGSFKLSTGDLLLLCSDGLSGMVHDDQLKSIQQEMKQSQLTCRETVSRMVAMALEAGGTDNVSVVLLELEEADTVQLGDLASMEKTMRMQSPPNILVAG